VKRRIIQLFFGLGLLITLAAGVLLLRGAAVTDLFIIERGRLPYEGAVIRCDGHRLALNFRWVDSSGLHSAPARSRGWSLKHRREEPVNYSFVRPAADRWVARLGFAFDVYGGRVTREVVVGIPWWFFACGGVVLGVATLGALRHPQGTTAACPSCGCDLRDAAQERCPECGQTVAGASHGEPSALSKMK
jgi:hypothetical protein